MSEKIADNKPSPGFLPGRSANGAVSKLEWSDDRVICTIMETGQDVKVIREKVTQNCKEIERNRKDIKTLKEKSPHVMTSTWDYIKSGGKWGGIITVIAYILTEIYTKIRGGI